MAYTKGKALILYLDWETLEELDQLGEQLRCKRSEAAKRLLLNALEQKFPRSRGKKIKKHTH